MNDGSFELTDHLFYLCGVGRSLSKDIHPELARNSTSVHFTVYPRKGSTAAIDPIYGATFVIKDAAAITIRAPARVFPALLALDEPQRTEHFRCKMFHFAYQMFDVDDISLTEGELVHRLRAEWMPIQGIRKDSPGCMFDPNTGPGK